jgi:hypothetical protein
MASKSSGIFGGDEPAGKKCAACDRRAECLESPENLQDFYATVPAGEYCCFARDVDIEECDSCIVEYESGIHAVYTQNFVVRREAGKRGARIVGFLGTLEFDWVSGIITVHHHFEDKVDTYDVNAEQTGTHFGGDEVLADSFLSVMAGGKSIAPLSSGIESARLCLAARRSATEHKMIELLDGVFSKISSSKKERFSVNQFNEYDYVELVEDRNVYSEYGLGKGSRGHILADHAVDGKILVEFIGVSDKMLEETMGLLTVDIDDLKKVEK